MFRESSLEEGLCSADRGIVDSDMIEDVSTIALDPES